MEIWSSSNTRPATFRSSSPLSYDYKSYRSSSVKQTLFSHRLVFGIILLIVIVLFLHHYFSSFFSSSSSSSSLNVSSIVPPRLRHVLSTLSHSISSSVHSAAAAVRSHVPLLSSLHPPFFHRPLNEGFSNGVDDKDFILTDGSGGITTYNVAALGTDIDAKVGAVLQQHNDLKNSLDALNLKKAVDNINWLMQFQLDDVRNKVLYCEAQINQHMIRNDKTYEIKSFLPNYDNCLDGGGNGQKCNWDNAFRRFALRETPHSLDSKVNTNNIN